MHELHYVTLTGLQFTDSPEKKVGLREIKIFLTIVWCCD